MAFLEISHMDEPGEFRGNACNAVNGFAAGHEGSFTNSLAVYDIPPVGMQYLPRHIRAILGSEENIAWRDFIGLSRSFHRNLLSEIGDFLGREGRGD